MCGFAGFYQPRPSGPSSVDLVRRMADAIAYRGPDDSGTWTDGGLTLGHRRLSVLDLSPAGHQPMHSEDGRHVIVFNGEIYNHRALRQTLESKGEAPAWRGTSDTETLLAGFAAWGIAATLRACVGMFALAVWDRRNKVLTLARDRLGEKPLYWGWQRDTLLFGSELAALRVHPAFENHIDRDALTLLLRHSYIPAPYSVYQGIRKLPAGHLLTLPLTEGSRPAVEPEPYWSFNEAVTEGLRHPFEGSDEQAIDALEHQLSASIRDQMLSDVPLGAFLSGGIDSSTTVALMQHQSARPVKTFTVGLDHGIYDEASHARAVARYLGTDHTELRIQPRDALDVIPRLPGIYSEPLAADSQIPIFLISHLARQSVTVVLSGDGGDELFGGYNRYLTARKVWRTMQRLPRYARTALAALLRALPPATWDRLFTVARPLLPGALRIAIPGTKAQKLANVLALSEEKAYFLRLCSHWPDPALVVRDAAEPKTLLTGAGEGPITDRFEHWMMAMDAQTFLPEEVLAKVDRAAMANSLETRVPMLDHRVVELAWRMPLELKIRHGTGKWLLRQVLYRHVPKALIERPKMGFGIPIDSWLRGPLRDWAESLLTEHSLKAGGYFYPAPIRKRWEEHLSGQYNRQYQLWPVLMFQAWLAEQTR